MKVFVNAVLLSFCFLLTAHTQTHGFVKSGVMGGTGGSLPFWMITNNFGRFSPHSVNTWLDAGIFPDTLNKNGKIKIDLGVEIFGRYDGAFQGWLHQGFAGLKWRFLHFYGGWKEEYFGSQDPELSSGFIMWSGNARPIPQISLATMDFVRVPYTKGFIEFKAGISHGWLGKDEYVKNAYLHHKYLYLRCGGSHSLNFTVGLHHFAQWAGDSPDFGMLPSGIKDFVKVFLAYEGKDSIPGVPYNEWLNRYGNHLGTYDISIDYRFRGGLKTKFYWQNFIEDNTGAKLSNPSDGLWGIQLEQTGRFKIGYEFLRSITHFKLKNGKPIGSDNYFNNGIYQTGWTYKGNTIGTPLIISPAILPYDYLNQIANNRVLGHILHIAMLFSQSRIDMRYSYTENFGNSYIVYTPSKIHHSLLLSMKKSFLSDKITGKLSFAWDRGNLLGNHLGMGVELGYQF